MKRKKLMLAFMLLATFFITLSFQYAPDGDGEGEVSNGTGRDWEQLPPIVDSVTFQLLAEPLEDGRNIVMRIKYLPDNTLPQTLHIFYDNGQSIPFLDDGSTPDAAAGDYWYAAYMQVDTGAFIAELANINSNIDQAGSFTEYEGHDGYIVVNPNLISISAFRGHLETPFPHYSITTGMNNCGTNLKPEYSLFITDLSVVEDPARTTKVFDANASPVGSFTGNASGAWTFGQMVKNMATGGGVSAKVFLREWVKTWLYDQNVNGDIVKPREDVTAFLIYPWLKKCDPSLNVSATLFGGVSPVNYSGTAPWEVAWNNCSEADLLKYAPFKLTAIVNRMDVRGNHAYGNTANNTGETRFIFSLIAPVSGTFIHGTPNSGGTLVGGTVPGPSQIAFNPSFAGVDWSGMNVIFEYSNVQTTNCDAQQFAQAWANLSTIGSFGNTYNTALQAITDQVTATNAAPGRPNGSAIGRIRTNERIFDPSLMGTFQTIVQRSWENADWQLRQFEIDATSHLLKQVPVANTPVASSNYAGLMQLSSSNGEALFIDNGLSTRNAANNPNAMVYTSASGGGLIDWSFNTLNQIDILHERHVMPAYFPGTTDPMTAGAATLAMDYVHTLDFAWRESTTNHPFTLGVTYTNSGNYATERKLRHKLALNTCQGCHAGETKTVFTQVRPLGYGEAADYYGTTPGTISDVSNGLKLDTRFVSNIGTTKVWHSSAGAYQHDPNYEASNADANRFFVKVSAFITGVNYTGTSSTTTTYQDDNPNDDATDASPNGDFYVNDPTNTSQTTVPFAPRPNDNQNSFNELKRRRVDLCSFINSSCSGSGGSGGPSDPIKIAAAVMLNPFRQDSH